MMLVLLCVTIHKTLSTILASINVSWMKVFGHILFMPKKLQSSPLKQCGATTALVITDAAKLNFNGGACAIECITHSVGPSLYQFAVAKSSIHKCIN